MAIWSRDAAADAVRAFEPVPRQWIASLHDVGTRGAASVHDVFQRCNKCGAGGEVLLGGRHTAFGRAHWRYCWMRVVRKPAKPWRSIDFAPDGRTALSGDGSQIKLWVVATGAERKNLATQRDTKTAPLIGRRWPFTV
jgi:hypothetical protein